MKNFPIVIVFMLAVFNLSLNGNNNTNPPLIPLPTSIEKIEGEFVLNSRTNLLCEDNNIRTYFTKKISEYTGIVLNGVNSDLTNNYIRIKIDPELNPASSESYKMLISEIGITISATDATGLFRGVQTLFQLIPPEIKSAPEGNSFAIPCYEIYDKPSFSWRGLNLDCGRHFMTPDFIKRYIDILAYYKFNTLHWHLTEDQGWRIEIKKYPKLTEIGAWRKEADGSIYGGYYTQEQIREIVEYAESRHINIVPEIEMPGHSLASLAAYPENSCTGGPFEVTNIWGVHKDIYCAGRDSTFTFLQNILDEVIDLFPGKYIHIGGDEAPKDRWEKCPKCQARIKAEGLDNEHELQSYFITRISKYLESKGREIIGWDEILEGGLAPGAIVQSWRGFQGATEAAKSGHYTISSPNSHTYLNHDPGDLDLRIAYSFNPIPDELTGDEKKYVLGSEANLWTEHAPQETVDRKLFPRILALAEVFWNNPNEEPNRADYDEFYRRVQMTYADLTARGIEYGRESKVIIPRTTYDKLNNTFIIDIKRGQNDIDIRYTLDGSVPGLNSNLFRDPIKVSESVKVNIAAFKNNLFIGQKITLGFEFHKALNSLVSLANPYEERYRAGGSNALVDGIRGTEDIHDDNWQGFEGVDFEATLDLGEIKDISKVIPRFILNSNSWVFLPEQVQVSLSDDGNIYNSLQVLVNDIPQKNSEIVLKDFPFEYNNVRARFIKVKAKSILKCPQWHPGAGLDAWLFIDEIVVE